MRLTSNRPCSTKPNYANGSDHKRDQNDAHGHTSNADDQRDENYACCRKSSQNDAHGHTGSAYDQRDEDYAYGGKRGQNDAHGRTSSRGTTYNQRRDEN